MKTIYIFQSKTLRLLSLIVGGIAVTSCGSYQNSSYYDNDGVYGSKTVTYDQQTQNETVVVVQKNKYEQQFGEMKEDFGPTEVFTDVDNYKSTPDTVYVEESTSRYAGWGENQTGNITVNVYDSWGWNSPYYGGWYNGWYGNNWGWNGWYGNSWYGSNWGWGWNSPYYGWGYSGYYGPYWGNSWYGGYYGPYCNYGWYGNGWYGRNVAYNNGPRGGNLYQHGNSGRYSAQGNSGRRGSNSIIGTPRTSANPRENNTGTPRTVIATPRNNSTGTPRTITTSPRDNNTGTPRTVISTPRTNTNTGTPRNQTSEPRSISTPRSNTSEPRSISTPRSSDFGGGRSSGGGSFGGGGRSSGGGGGGRGGRG